MTGLCKPSMMWYVPIILLLEYVLLTGAVVTPEKPIPDNPDKDKAVETVVAEKEGGGKGGRGHNRSRKHPDGKHNQLTDKQWVKYHPFFNFPPHVYTRFSQSNGARMRGKHMTTIATLREAQALLALMVTEKSKNCTYIYRNVKVHQCYGYLYTILNWNQCTIITSQPNSTGTGGATMFGGQKDCAAQRHLNQYQT